MVEFARIRNGSDGDTPATDNAGGAAKRDTSNKYAGNDDVCSSFKRTEVIGRGKFGVVYKGYHLKTKQVYAIKVLDLDSDSDEVDDVQREIQFLSSLKQVPNITLYYGSYLKNTSLWIIMEYCAGGSLRTLLRPGKIDEKYIGVIVREILVALQYIHRDNVIHRDIKAANVLITNEGKIKLCDFGVAAQLNQSSLRRQTMAGTPYWMAPEVIMEGVYYDTKVDIWSLGITTYEIATGNPPYCDVEALRAMQMITKSKPARLEGRNYSPALKEFIALCLDEDPKERLSADELLKSKLIKAHRATSTSILKELITRYLLYRDKTKSAKTKEVSASSIEAPPDMELAKKKTADPETAQKEHPSDSDLVDFKWDFDSLSSREYIIENDINVDAILGNNSEEWTRNDNEQLNFAYPEEEQYYHNYQTNNYNNVRKFTHDASMGRNQSGTIFHNSTLNIPMGHAYGTTYNNSNNTSNAPNLMKSTYNNNTGTVANTGLPTATYGTGNSTGKKHETRATKKLLQLFEEDDIINEETDRDTELPNLPKPHTAQPTSSIALSNNAQTFLSGPAYHSQSTPILPVLQTSFNKPLQGPGSVVTSVPTPVEIEIPEELPVSAVPTPATATATSVESSNVSESKARSATISIAAGTHSQPHGISRRLTISNSNTNSSSLPNIRTEPKIGAKEKIADNTGIALPATTSLPTGISTSSKAAKLTRRTPSPSVIHSGTTISPTKKPTVSPKGNLSINDSMSLSSTNAVPGSSKTVSITSATDNKDNISSPAVSLPISKEKDETSRVNRDFKKNNPNLKLQMPSPTNVMPNKLLDTNPTVSNNTTGGTTTVTNEGINQFGFNTSSAANIPISMTPISEKHMDFGSRPKRSQSAASNTRAAAAAAAAASVASSASAMMNQPSNSTETTTTTTAVAATTPAILQSAPSTGITRTTSASTTTTSSTVVNNSNTTNSTPVGSIPHRILPSTVMPTAPQVISSELFSDFNVGPEVKHVDRKPQMLKELENLLRLFERGLDVLDNTLKSQLTTITAISPEEEKI